MIVKVGLDTSSGSAAPSPFAIPLAIVVLPAPRFPMSSTAHLRGSVRASASPAAIVSSAEDVRKCSDKRCVHSIGGFPHRLRQKLENIGGDKTLLADHRLAELPAAAV